MILSSHFSSILSTPPLQRGSYNCAEKWQLIPRTFVTSSFTSQPRQDMLGMWTVLCFFFAVAVSGLSPASDSISFSRILCLRISPNVSICLTAGTLRPWLCSHSLQAADSSPGLCPGAAGLVLGRSNALACDLQHRGTEVSHQSTHNLSLIHI